jgi:hypothetical protein
MAENKPNLYSVIAGTANQNVIPSSSALESLKLLQWFQSQGSLDPDVEALYREETKYLKASMNMINNDPIIASKFGTDLQSAMNLSGLLKEVYSEQQAKAHLLSYIDGGKVESSEAQKALGRFKKGGAITTISD